MAKNKQNNLSISGGQQLPPIEPGETGSQSRTAYSGGLSLKPISRGLKQAFSTVANMSRSVMTLTSRTTPGTPAPQVQWQRRPAQAPVRLEALEPRVLLAGDVNPTALTINGEISKPGERDAYEFNVDQTTQVVFDSRTNRSDLTWNLVGPAGQVTNKTFNQEDGGPIELTPGKYRLNVDGVYDAVGAYSLRLIDAAAAVELTLDQLTTGTLTQATGSAVYKFNAQAGDKLWLSGQNNSNWTWRLIDPFGRQEASGNNYYYQTEFGPNIAQRTGSYLFIIEGSNQSAASSALPFSFTLKKIQDTVRAIALDQLVAVNIDQPGKVEKFTIHVDQATPVLFDPVGGGDWSWYWNIEGAGGSTVSNRDWSYYASSRTFAGGQGWFVLPPGDHTLSVSRYFNYTGQRSFRLLTGQAAQNLTAGSSLSDVLSHPRGSQIYKLQLQEGQKVFMNGRSVTGGGISWQLMDPFGYSVASGGSVLGAQTTRAIQKTGEYWLIIDGNDNNAETANVAFELSLEQFADKSEALTLGAVTQGSIDTAGQTVFFQFDIANPSIFAFDSLSNRSDLSWTLTGPYGNIFTDIPLNTADAGNRLALWRLDPGRYKVGVKGASGGKGAFAFKLTDALQEPLYSLGSALSATLTPGNSNSVHRVSLLAGDQISFLSTSVSGGAASWRLVDPFGRDVWGSNNLSSNRNAASVAYTGDYLLVIEGAIANTADVSFSVSLNLAGHIDPAPLHAGIDYVLGTTVSGLTPANSGRDVYRFTLSEESLLAMDSLTRVWNPIWQLVGPRGVEISPRYLNASDANNAVPFMLLPAGDYALYISDYYAAGQTPYSFRLLNSRDAEPIQLGVSLSGQRNPANSSRGYMLSAQEGDQLVLYRSDRNSTWRLIDAWGRRVADPVGTPDYDVMFTIPRTGDYWLLNEGQNYSGNGALDVNFKLTRATTTIISLAFDELIGGSLAGNHETHEYSFELSQATALIFDSLLPHSYYSYDGNPLAYPVWWQLKGPSGNINNWTSFYDGGDGPLSLQAGQYKLYLRTPSDIQAAYQFRILTAQAATSVALSTEVTGAFDAKQYQLFKFNAQQGQTYSFESARLPSYGGYSDPYYEITDPLGRVIRTGSSSDSRFTWKANLTGEYVIALHSAGSDGYYKIDPVQGYRIRVVQDTVVSQSVELDAWMQGALSQAAQTQRYSLTLTEPKRILMDLGTAASGTTWSLTGPRGSEAAARSFGQGNQVFDLPAGTYQLDVSRADMGVDPGFYFRLLDLDITAQVNINQSSTLTLDTASGRQAMVLDIAEAGDFVFDKLEGNSNINWQIVDVKGRVISSGNANNDSSKFNLQAGRYYLIASGPQAQTVELTTDFSIRRAAIVSTSHSLNQSVSASLSSPAQTNEHKFAIDAASWLVFDRLIGAGDLQWSLRGPSGQLVNARDWLSSNESPSPVTKLLTAGEYVLTVYSPSHTTQEYGFKLLNPGNATVLNKWEYHTVELSPTDTAQLVAFDAAQSGLLTWGGYAPSSIVYLLNANGDVIQSGYIGTIQLPTAGRYYVLLSGRATGGDLQIGNVYFYPHQWTETSLPVGGLGASSAASNYGRHSEWTFEITQAGCYLIQGLQNLFGSYQLERSDGMLFKTGTLNQGPAELNLGIGRYRLMIDESTNRGINDSYKLWLSLAVSDAPAAALQSVDFVQSAAPGGYTFIAQQAQEFILQAGMNAGRFRVWVFGPDGSQKLQEIVDPDQIIIWRADVAGQHTFWIQPEGVNDATSAVQFSWDSLNIEKRSASLGQLLEANLASNAHVIDYEITVPFGLNYSWQEIVAQLSQDTGLTWALRTSAADDHTAAGRYILRVSTSRAEGQPFRIKLGNPNGSPLLVQPQELLSLENSSDVLFRRIDISQEQDYRFILNGQGTWSLRSSSGQHIGEGSSGQGIRQFHLLPGRYYLRIAGDGASNQPIEVQTQFVPSSSTIVDAIDTTGMPVLQLGEAKTLQAAVDQEVDLSYLVELTSVQSVLLTTQSVWKTQAQYGRLPSASYQFKDVVTGQTVLSGNLFDDLSASSLKPLPAGRYVLSLHALAEAYLFPNGLSLPFSLVSFSSIPESTLVQGGAVEVSTATYPLESFVVQASAGERVTIRIQSPSGKVLSDIVVFDPNGVRLSKLDIGGGLYSFNASYAGEYSVLVQSVLDESEIRLSIDSASIQQLPLVQLNQTRSETQTYLDNWYRLEASSEVVFSCSFPETDYPYFNMKIYSATSGALVFEHNEYGGQFNPYSADVLPAGQYVVYVSGYDYSYYNDPDSDYKFQVNNVLTMSTSSLAVGAATTINPSAAGTVQVHTVALMSGQVLNLYQSSPNYPNWGRLSDFYVLGPDGLEVVAYPWVAASSDSDFTFQAKETGTYRLVSKVPYGGLTINSSLYIDDGSQSSAPLVDVNGVGNSLTLDEQQSSQAVSFNIAQGTQVYVKASSASQVSIGYQILKSGSGLPVYRGRVGVGFEASLPLLVAGNYEISFYFSEAISDIPQEVFFSLHDVDAGAIALSADASISNQADAAGGIQFFKISWLAGQKQTISANSDSGDALSFAVYDSQGYQVNLLYQEDQAAEYIVLVSPSVNSAWTITAASFEPVIPVPIDTLGLDAVALGQASLFVANQSTNWQKDFHINLSQGSTILLDGQASGMQGVQYSVFDAATGEMIFSETFEQADVNPVLFNLAAGSYVLRLSAAQLDLQTETSYVFTLHELNFTTLPELANHDSLIAPSANIGNYLVRKINLQEGDVLALDFLSNSADKGTVGVYSPNFSKLDIAPSWVASSSKLLRLVAPVSGEYLLISANSSLLSGPVDADLLIELTDQQKVEIDAPVLSFETLTFGHIDAGSVTRYRIDLDESGLVNIALKSTASYPYTSSWSLKDNFGNVIESGTIYYDGFLAKAVNLSSGSYELVLHSPSYYYWWSGQSWSAADFSIRIDRASYAPQQTQTEFNVTSPEHSVYQLDLQAGQASSFSPQGAGSWKLLDRQGTVLRSGMQGGSSYELIVAISDTYFLAVESDWGAFQPVRIGDPEYVPQPNDGRMFTGLGFTLRAFNVVREPLLFGQSLVGPVTSQEIKIYEFDLNEPKRIYLDDANYAAYGSWQLLLDGREHSVRYTSNGAGIEILELQAGHYEIVMTPERSSINGLSFRLLDPGSAAQAQLNQTSTVQTRFGDAYVTSFEISTDSKVDFRLDSYDIHAVRVYDEFGREAAQLWYPEYGVLTQLFEASPGKYFLVLDAPAYGGDLELNFQLNVTPKQNEQILLEELIFDTQRPVQWSTSGQAIFTINATQEAWLFAQIPTAFDGELQLLDMQGRVLQIASMSAQTMGPLRVPNAGQYQLRLLDSNINNGLQTTTIKLAARQPADATLISLDNRVSGALVADASPLLMRFEGQQNMPLTLDRLGSSSAATQWQIFRANGELLINGNLGADSGNIVLPYSGTYYLALSGADAAYEFNLRSPKLALPFNQIIEGQLEAANNSVAVYYFHLDEASPLAFDVLQYSDKLTWTLEGPNGAVFSQGMPRERLVYNYWWGPYYYFQDKSGPLQKLPAGDYRLVIRTYENTVSQPYRFRVLNQLGATPLVAGTAITTSIAPSIGARAFTFDAVAGERYYFDALAATTNYASPVSYSETQPAGEGELYWRLIDPLGREVFNSRLGYTNRGYYYDYSQGQYFVTSLNFVPTDQEPASIAITGKYTLLIEGGDTPANTQAVTANFGLNLVRVEDAPVVQLDSLLVIPAPDLVVNSVQISPAQGLHTGDEIVVTWMLENRGLLDATLNWNDRIILRNEDTGQLLASYTVPHATTGVQGVLPAGQARQRAYSLRIPDGARSVGNVSVTVVTDADRFIRESNASATAESNNAFATVIVVLPTPYADLKVEAFTVSPVTSFEPGSDVQVSWETVNAGDKLIDAPWSERLEIVDTATNRVVSSSVIRDADAQAQLESGGRRARSLTLVWPEGVASAGAFSFRVSLDIMSEVLESNSTNTGESNNTAQILRNSGPDLQVIDLTVDAGLIEAGGLITVRWKDSNVGAVSAMGSYNDRIVVRNLAYNQVILDSSVAMSTEALAQRRLLSGQSVERSFTFRLPEGLRGTGALEISVTADQNSAGLGLLFETQTNANAEANNTTSLSVQSVAKSYADLRSSILSLPTDATAGQAVTVQWEVSNAGQAVTTAQWNDQIIFSRDSIFGNADDVVLSTVRHSGVLQVGQSYQSSAVVLLPVVADGAYRIAVKADSGQELLEPDTRADNISNPYAINLSAPYSDLQVSQVTAPAAAMSGEQVTVSWSVRNAGNAATSVAIWADRVVFSKSPTPANDDIVVAGAVYRTAVLQADGSYIGQARVTVPRDLQGDYYVRVYVDSQANLVERNENNNVVTSASPMRIALSPVADLRVSDVSGPTTAIQGQTVTVSYRNSNAGESAATAPWRDRIYLKTSSSTYELANIWVTNTLAAGQSEDRSVSFQIPDWMPEGNWQWLVKTDTDNTVHERDYETNNENISAANVFVARPDLMVTRVTGPGLAVSGNVITVNWDVSNLGNRTEGTWIDKVYLSRNGVQQLVKEVTITRALERDGSYTASADLELPLGFDGAYDVAVTTNHRGSSYYYYPGSSIRETQLSNNTATGNVVQVQLAAYADLVISDVQAPVRTIADPATVDVSYTVTNSGTGAGRTSAWTDKIVFSQDGIVGNGDDWVVAESTHLGALEVGQSYSNTVAVRLPPYTSGRYNLFVVADSKAQVFENFNEANNTAGALHPIDVMPVAYADLRIDSVSAQAISGVPSSGQPMRVSWTVSNQGIGITNTNQWSDSVWLSRNADGSGQVISFSGATHLGELDVGASYTRSINVTLPEGLEGTYYINVRTGGPFEFIYGDNNTGSTSAIAVTLSRSPDLLVESISLPSTAQEGDLIDISWTVINQGQAPAAGVWTDTVILEPFDGGATVTVGNFSYDRGNLDAGISYTRTEQVRLPSKIEGLYRLRVVTNASAQLYEHGAARNNNATLSQGAVQVSLNDRPDLRVTALAAPERAVAGGSAAVRYSITNLGSVAASGRWLDSVYLSLDGNLSGDDVLVGRFQNGGALSPTESYAIESASVPDRRGRWQQQSRRIP
jgi:subtilase family serine protease